MRTLTTKNGNTYPLPLFLPVFQIGNPYITIEELQKEFSINGIITNAFFLYKNKELRSEVNEIGVKKLLNFDGLVVTDSGAFQQFSGPLYLSNMTMISFQQKIGADIISPLDLITTPNDNWSIAQKKLESTLKRIEKGIAVTDQAILIGVQQGGRFLALREQALYGLLELGAQYIALGSLVPFFNKNHNIELIGRIIKQAREIIPSTLPIHLYGAGDPVELPFYIALGCDIFDSSSFIHYAKDDWYMTPYGALKGAKMVEAVGYQCECPYCQNKKLEMWEDVRTLVAHNLWVILDVLRRTSESIKRNCLNDQLIEIISVHQKWFPNSQLARTWDILFKGVSIV